MKVVVPIGVLLPGLDYTKSTDAFNVLFQQKKLKPLDKEGWEAILPDILKVDIKFKRGRITSTQFREKLSEFFSEEFGKPIQFSDKEFNEAWNAMLGDVSSLKKTVETLRDTLKEKGHMLVLMSGTNLLHFNYLFRKTNMPFESVPIFLTYADQLAEVGVYTRIVDELTEHHDKQFLMIRSSNQYSPFEATKNREDTNRRKIRRYIAENKDLEFKKIDLKGDVMQQILKAVDDLAVKTKR